MNSSIDPRIELLSIAQYLSKYGDLFPLVTKHKSEYTTVIDEHFGKYNKHPFVEMNYIIGQKGFCFDAPIAGILETDLDINAEKLFWCGIVSDYVSERIDDNFSFKEYISLANDFIYETKFCSFYKSKQNQYTSINKNYEETFNNIKCDEQLYEYYKYKKGNAVLYLAPLLRGYFSITKKNVLVSVIGLDGQLTNTFLSIDLMNELLWHELSHSYINPLTKKHINDVMEKEKLFFKISEKMKEQYYGNWECCVNEHIIRAIVCKFMQKYYGKDKYLKCIEEEIKNGFIYLNDVLFVLNNYEKKNNISFNELYPDIIMKIGEA